MQKKDLPAVLTKGCEKIITNAQRLFISAVDIKKSNLPLSYFIFHISMEEVAKIEIIGKELTGFYNLKNREIDINKIKKKIFSHKEKNFENAYFQPKQNYEIEALKSKNSTKILKSHKILQEKFHKERNDLKNNSLYTSLDSIEFILPDDIINLDMVNKIEKEAFEYISMMFAKIDILQKWLKKPPKERKTVEEAIKEARELVGIVKSVRRKFVKNRT